MVAIGGCDYCGEFCAQLGVLSVESFLEDLRVEEPDDPDDDEAWAAAEAAAEAQRDEAGDGHRSLVYARLSCAALDGWEYAIDHAGRLHEADWTRIERCSECAYDSPWDAGDWDTKLDHAQCSICWASVGGGALLDRWRRESGAVGSPDSGAPITTASATRTDRANRATVEAALRAYAGEGLPPVRWVPSPIGPVEALVSRILEFTLGGGGGLHSGAGPWSIRSGEATALAAGASGFEKDVEEDAEQDGDEQSDREPAPGSPESPRREIVGHLARAITSNAAPASGGIGLATAILEDAGQFADPSPAVVASSGRDRAAKRALLRVLAENAGPVAVLPDEIVVAERPLVCALDDRGRVHRETGPAIAYADGLQTYAWHGVLVPAWVIDEPERLTPATIDAQQSVEVRRAMVERFGPDRLLREGGATLMHEDAFGRLWHRAMPAIEVVGPAGRTWSGHSIPGRRTTISEEPMAYVEVQDATPGSDGASRTYFLRVPPDLRTARDAVAWTFGREGSEYAPDVES